MIIYDYVKPKCSEKAKLCYIDGYRQFPFVHKIKWHL